MRHILFIWLLTFNTARAQILQKGEAVHIEDNTTGLWVSPDEKWIFLNTFASSRDYGMQKTYLINPKGEKVNELIGQQILGFKTDSKSVIVRHLESMTVRELSLPAFNIIAEFKFREGTTGLSEFNAFYLPTLNRIIFCGSLSHDEEKPVIELWDWRNKKRISILEGTAYAKDLIETYCYSLSADERKLLFFGQSQPMLLNTESLQLISTIGMDGINVENGVYLAQTCKLSHDGTLISLLEYPVYNADNESYSTKVHFFDAYSGKKIQSQQWSASVLSLHVDAADNIITTGYFKKRLDNGAEMLRKIERKTGQVITSFRTIDYSSAGYLKNRSTIYWYDPVKSTLTPFNVQTWTKGNQIKL
jgi:hypothetical protein